MDGSTTDVPDTKENAEYFGRPSNATRDGAFPQVRWLVAAESGTGALIGAALGPYTVGEQTLARDLLAAFGPGMLVLADRNFLSHTLARDVLATGAHILWRASASFRLTPIAVLADGSYLAQLHPRRKADGPPITVRVIEYTVHTSPAGGSDGEEDTSEVFALVTDLLDIEAYPALDLACAYPMRWGCETVIGHHKTDMGAGKAVLRSKDPEGVAQEMWALFAVYQAIHTLIGAAVDATGIPPGQDQLPARAGRRDRLGHGGLSPLRILTWPWPRSCSRSSTRASSSATAPTGPAHAPPRRPATSPPAKINPASSASPDASRSTASDPDPQAKRKDIGSTAGAGAVPVGGPGGVPDAQERDPGLRRRRVRRQPGHRQPPLGPAAAADRRRPRRGRARPRSRSSAAEPCWSTARCARPGTGATCRTCSPPRPDTRA